MAQRLKRLPPMRETWVRSLGWEDTLEEKMVKNSAANAGNIRDAGSIPGLGRSLGEGNGNPLRYSCLENPMDGEAW